MFLAIGMGGKAAVVPVFLAEIAPAHIRAATIMNWYESHEVLNLADFEILTYNRQVFDAFGIALGFTANLLASQAS